MPAIVLTLVLTLIIFGVGVFAFYVTTSQVGYTTRQTETFSVSDPTVAKTCDLSWEPESIVSVEQYNGITWVTVSSSYYSLTNSQLVVQPEGMQG